MTSERWAYRPHLDGLRAIAVYLVVAFHAGVTHMDNGFVGVDAFFGLSGFLVTSILLVEHANTGTIRLRHFYLRRVLRLLPAAVVAIVGAALLMLLTQPELLRTTMVDDARAALLYVANWHFLSASTSYFDTGAERSAYLHFWSLAIEEQFYLVFPAAVLVILGRRRRAEGSGDGGSVRRLGIVIGAVAAASVVAQIVWAQRSASHAYYGTEARLYQLLAGSLLAIAVFGRTRRLLPEVVGRWGQLGAVAALVVLGTDLVDVDVWLRGMLATVATVAVITTLEASPRGPVGAVLATRAPTFLGRISYGTYLWHWPLILALRAMVDVSPLVLCAMAGVGATAIAALTHELFEDPLRRSRPLTARPVPVIAAGLAVSVLTAVLVVPPILESTRKPAVAAGATGQAADPVIAQAQGPVRTLLDAPVPEGLDLATVAEDSVKIVPRCVGEEVRECVVRRGRGLHVHLMGDSNAIMMIPLFRELADEQDFRLTASVIEGCVWQPGLDTDITNFVAPCNEMRNDAYERVLPALAPDIVIVVSLARDDAGMARTPFVAGTQELAALDPAELFDVATRAAVDRILATGARLVIIEPLPFTTTSPTECLSGARQVGECAFTTGTEPLGSETTYRSLAEEFPGQVFTVSLDRVTCPQRPICLPIVDDMVVYRDKTHIWSEFLVAHRDEIWARITGSGATAGLPGT